MSGPLDGVTVLDLTSVISGPLCTAVLADQGARVIKVETLTGDGMRVAGALRNGVSSMFSAMNRNKESIAIDLQKAEGVALVRKLAAGSDICIQNYRPGVVEKLGLGFEDLSQVNPGIIYGSISGVGPTGPYADRRVYDPVIQAYAGFAATQLTDGKPDLIRTMICDKVTSLTMAQALTAALYERKTTGAGQHVEVSMLEAALYFIWPDRMFPQTFVEKADFDGVDIASMYKTIETADGFITVISVQLAEFQGLCRALKREDWLEDPRFADLPSLYVNFTELYDQITGEIKTWQTTELCERLLAEDVPHAVILDMDDVLTDPQIAAADIITTIDDALAGQMRLVNRNARFSNSVTGIHTPAPSLGQHAETILKEFGYDDNDIDSFRKDGVIL